MTKKTCSNCKKLVELNKFYPSKNGKMGTYSVCKDCIKERRKQKDNKMQIKRSEVRELLKSAGATFFTVEFIKKDNTLRKLNGRLNVKKHLHGGKSTTKHLDKYITVYDVKAKDYRNVNIETIQSVKVLGKTYKVI